MYFLIYIIVGLILSAFVVVEFCKRINKKEESQKTKDSAMVLSLIVLPLFCVPFWPMLITLLVIGLVRKIYRKIWGGLNER